VVTRPEAAQRARNFGKRRWSWPPGRDWSWINRIASRIRAQHKPARPKRSRLVNAGELLDLGLDLLAQAENENTVRRRAITYRDGLIIALLAVRPLRLRNLAGLVLDHNLVRRGDGWWLEVAAEETKNKDPIELPWPDALVPALEIYLNRYRPFLARMRGRWSRPCGEALWLSTDGSPMTKMAIYDRVVGRTQEALGHPINPHLFRDCAAASIAIDDPTQAGTNEQPIFVA
jgi:integrase/recombinase XerD